MDSIFSDDDEAEAFREQLYEGPPIDEDVELVPMFGLYTLVKKSGEPKPREDLFLRGMEKPSNNLDPYASGTFESKKHEMKKKSSLATNFSFFSKRKNKVEIEKTEKTSADDYIAERKRLLESLNAQEKQLEDKKEDVEKEEDDEENEDVENQPPKTPVRCTKKSTSITPKLTDRKRRLVTLSSCSDDSDSDGWESEVRTPRPPRRKRVSPDLT